MLYHAAQKSNHWLNNQPVQPVEQQQGVIIETPLQQPSENNNDDRIILAAVNLNNVREHYGGKMDVICKHCSVKYFQNEIVADKKDSFHDCC